jgi:uncharacterized membrane protein YphA (DoxX/SURF4 family)
MLTEDKKPPDIDCGAGVAAIQATLVAASNTVLAPGLGFAVIDRDGRVVLHSDERRALFENLYEEMEDGERLRAIVLARATERISTSYLGRPHRVFATPLENLPWTVVTFSDKELVNTATLEILGHSAALSFGVVLAYAVLALLYFLLVGPVMHHWFWPGSHNGRMAKWTLGIPGAAVVAPDCSDGVRNDDWSVMTAIVLPFLVFAGISDRLRTAIEGKLPGGLFERRGQETGFAGHAVVAARLACRGHLARDDFFRFRDEEPVALWSSSTATRS